MTNEKNDSDDDLDPIDFNNYKGMFFNDEPGQKFQDPETGAHFEYKDMCKRINKLKQELQQFDDYQMEEVQAGEKPMVILKKQNKSGAAFKAIQALLSRLKTKDSRNDAQALPEQGYGTAGLDYKDDGRSGMNKIRQFSSQFDQQQHKAKLEKKPTDLQPSMPNPVVNRSKSTDKPQLPIEQKTLNGFYANAVPLIKGIPSGQNKKKEVSSNRQKITENCLSEYKPKANYRYQNNYYLGNRTRTDQNAVGHIEELIHRLVDKSKVRHSFSRNQDRKLYETNNEQKGSDISAIYCTGTNKTMYKHRRNIQRPETKWNLGSHTRKLKISLGGVEQITHQSRNMIAHTTTIKDNKDAYKQERKEQITHLKPNYSFKKTYVSGYAQVKKK